MKLELRVKLQDHNENIVEHTKMITEKDYALYYLFTKKLEWVREGELSLENNVMKGLELSYYTVFQGRRPMNYIFADTMPYLEEISFYYTDEGMDIPYDIESVKVFESNRDITDKHDIVWKDGKFEVIINE